MAAAGVWDDLGDLVVLRPGLVQVKFAISSDVSWSDVDDDLDDAKQSLFAERALLKIAMGTSGTASRQALARCVSFDVPYKYDKPRLALCTAKFELLQPHWDKTTGSVVWPSTASFSVTNSGSTCQTQRTLCILFNSLHTIWTLTNTTNGMQFIYDGVTHPVSHLRIHCGELTVEDAASGGNDVWEFSAIGDNQIGFMALEPGVNNFTQSPTLSMQWDWYESYL